ncbi:MAG: hypothetical protein E7370_00800 [Clostridiales bacterium]|nr:hypothetical protein [Clostridiales bacterium]
MKTKRKISVAAYCLALILLVTILFGATGCDILNILYGPTFEDVYEVIDNNFSVQLPQGGTLQYRVHGSHFLDNDHYYVISYEQEPTEYIADFSYEESEELKEKFNSAIECILTGLEREGETFNQDYAFNWEWEYCWKMIDADEDTLILIYRPETLQLYVCENFM